MLGYGWFRGLQLVPIGDAEAIIFLAPLLIVFVARIYLKEELPKVFTGTFILTVAGIMFVCQVGRYLCILYLTLFFMTLKFLYNHDTMQPAFLFTNKEAKPVSALGFIFLVIMV